MKEQCQLKANVNIKSDVTRNVNKLAVDMLVNWEEIHYRLAV
jgi:hypothetical protein